MASADADDGDGREVPALSAPDQTLAEMKLVTPVGGVFDSFAGARPGSEASSCGAASGGRIGDAMSDVDGRSGISVRAQNDECKKEKL
jgi:hypothetical protein